MKIIFENEIVVNFIKTGGWGKVFIVYKKGYNEIDSQFIYRNYGLQKIME